jgi:hypothetical protein
MPIYIQIYVRAYIRIYMYIYIRIRIFTFLGEVVDRIFTPNGRKFLESSYTGIFTTY